MYKSGTRIHDKVPETRTFPRTMCGTTWYAGTKKQEGGKNVQGSTVQLYDWRAWWDLVQNMSPVLQRAVAKRVYDGTVCSNMFLLHSKVDAESLPLLLSAFLVPKTVEAGHIFYRAGDQPQALYFVLRGHLSFAAVPSELGGIANISMIENLVQLSDQAETVRRYPYVIFGPANYVGEWEMIVPHARKACLRAETETKVLTLGRNQFIMICHTFPQLLENLRITARRREERRKKYFKQHNRKLDYMGVAANIVIGRRRIKNSSCTCGEHSEFVLCRGDGFVPGVKRREALPPVWSSTLTAVVVLQIVLSVLRKWRCCRLRRKVSSVVAHITQS